MRLFRSYLFQLLFMLWTALLALAALPVLIDTRRFGGSTVGRLWGYGTLLLLRICCNIHYRVEGREHLPSGSALIVAKHQSAWETAALWPILGNPSFVLKKELLKIPLFGWYLSRLHNIPIDRAGGGKALKTMLAAAKNEASHGRKLVIFPEGTRIAYGEKGEYQPGAAVLALQLGLPVVPVALNSGACWSRDSLLKNPGTITLRFLPALPEGLTSRDMLKAIEQTIEDGCAALPNVHATA